MNLPPGLDPRHADRFRSILAGLEGEAAKIQTEIDAHGLPTFVDPWRRSVLTDDGQVREASLKTPKGRETIALDRLAKEIAQLDAIDRDLDAPARDVSNGRSSHAHADSPPINPPTPEGVGGLPIPLPLPWKDREAFPRTPMQTSDDGVCGR